MEPSENSRKPVIVQSYRPANAPGCRSVALTVEINRPPFLRIKVPDDLEDFMRQGLPGVSLMRNGLPVFAILLVCLPGVPAHADSVNLLVNGSFEQPIVWPVNSCGAYSDCLGFHNGVVGDDNIAGWQLIGKGGVDINGDPIPGAPATVMVLGSDYAEPFGEPLATLNFHPQDGQQSVDLTGEGNQGTTNGIKQSVGTTPGSVYGLTFWLGHQDSSAPGYAEGPASIALYIDGALVGTYDNSFNTTQDVTWRPFSYEFTASSPSTVVAFLNNSSFGNNYAGLDNVALAAVPGPSASVTAVPEPSSLLFLGAGIICMAARWSRPR